MVVFIVILHLLAKYTINYQTQTFLDNKNIFLIFFCQFLSSGSYRARSATNVPIGLSESELPPVKPISVGAITTSSWL